MTTVIDIINIATSELGYGETSGNNLTKYGTWYGIQDQWCAIFVSYVFARAGMPLKIDTKKGFSYCPSGVAWFKANPPWKWLKKVSKPAVGDIVFYDWHPETPESDAWHVGIVASIGADGSVTCIDGNYGPYPAKVARHKHPVVNIYGYARPPYSPASPTPIPTIVPWPGRYFTLTSPYTEGRDILMWQQKMISAGFALGASGPTGKGDDGQFGPICYEKAKQFQRNNQLEVDGIIGPESWGKLFNP